MLTLGFILGKQAVFTHKAAWVVTKGMKMLRILGRMSSINVRKVVWACGELGLDYEREDWGAGFRSPREAQFLELNPNALVPVIEDDGFVLWESNAIVRYLSEKYGKERLLGSTAEQRAIVDQWFSWQSTDVGTAAGYATRALIRKLPEANDPGLLAQSLRDWGDKMAILDKQLARTQAFVAGPQFSAADIGLGLAGHRWLSLEVDKPDYNHVVSYVARLKTETQGSAMGVFDYA